MGRRSRKNLKIINHIMEDDNDEEEMNVISASKPKQGIKRKSFAINNNKDIDEVDEVDNEDNVRNNNINRRKKRILASNSSQPSPKTVDSIQSNDKIKNGGNQKYDDDGLNILSSKYSSFNSVDMETNTNSDNVVNIKSNTSTNIANIKSNTNINIANTNSNINTNVTNNNLNTSINIVTDTYPNINSNSNSNNNGVNLNNLENITNTTIINNYNSGSFTNDTIQTNIEFNVSNDKPVDIPKNNNITNHEKNTNGAPVGIVPSNTLFEIAIPSSSVYRIQSDNNMNKNSDLINLLEMKLRALDRSFDSKGIKSFSTPFSETKPKTSFQSFTDGLKPLSMTNNLFSRTTNMLSSPNGTSTINSKGDITDNFNLLDEKIRSLNKLSKINVKSSSSVRPMDNFFNSIPKNVVFNSKNKPFKFLTSRSKNGSLAKNGTKNTRRVNEKREKKRSYNKSHNKENSLKDSFNNTKNMFNNKDTTKVVKQNSSSKSSMSTSTSTPPKKDELGFFIDGKFINENDIEFDDGDEEYEDIDEKSHKRKFFSTRKRF